MFCRLPPMFPRTAVVSSLTAQMSPASTSKLPWAGSSIRRRASTPASYQFPLPLATQLVHEVASVTLTSLTAWNGGARGRGRGGCTGPRGVVFSAAVGGGGGKNVCDRGEFGPPLFPRPPPPLRAGGSKCGG